MADTSKIEWTDSTFNPWIGCQHASPGCDHCYAEQQNIFRKWAADGAWGPHAERRRTSVANWKKPVVRNTDGRHFERTHGRRRRVFCASLADVFDNKVPVDWRTDLFRLIRDTPNLDWQLLTKRPENIANMLPPDWGTAGYPNVWLGATTEDEKHYRMRWPVLARVPAVVHFISYEPAIGSLGRINLTGSYPDWIIAGGESGPKARITGGQWARAVRDECRDLGIPFFFRQWGICDSNPLVLEQGMSKEDASVIDTHGKGGGLLDGQIVRQFPTFRPGAQSKLNVA
jgi:protein gp37